MKTVHTALLVLALAVTPTLAAHPATAAVTDDAVTWSVRPGDQDEADGRAWVEWEAGPGESRIEHMVVTNHSGAAVEFVLSAADGYFTDAGRFNMLASDEESVAAGTWIDLPESVLVPAGGTEVVPFTVTVPERATPGDHVAGVAASVRSAGDGTVGVESRVGFRVMTRVAGDLAPELSVAVSGAYSGVVNPFDAGALDVTYEVENTGNVRLRTQPEILVSGPFGLVSHGVQAEEIVEIAPGETRRGTVRISSAWPVLTYDVNITAGLSPVSDELSFDGAEQANARTTTLAVPWSQLVVLVVTALLVVWSALRRRHARTRTQQMIAQAREEALAEARASSDGARPRELPIT
ncbi:hypothetical protein UQW22_13315 [Isoptericola halotolerans]|uniref:COG1470 family protein n=1 Tax=Isoptericola halotolerans TaxID=300560 RepID=UPI00388E77CB